MDRQDFLFEYYKAKAESNDNNIPDKKHWYLDEHGQYKYSLDELIPCTICGTFYPEEMFIVSSGNIFQRIFHRGEYKKVNTCPKCRAFIN